MAKRKGSRQMPNTMSHKKHYLSGHAPISPRERLRRAMTAVKIKPVRPANTHEDIDELYAIRRHHKDVLSGEEG